MSGFNVHREIDSDNDGSQIGIDLLFNPKKMKPSSGLSDDLSVRSIPINEPKTNNNPSRFVDLGESDDGDVEVHSTKSDDGGGFFKSHASPPKQTFSEVTDSESGYGGAKQPQYSGEDILNMKREILYQLNRLEKRGVSIPKKFSLSSSLDEMKTEYERLKRDLEVDASIRFQRRMLMACVTGIEFLNEKFDPLDVHLSGWSSEVGDNLDDYSDIFEELHDKYKGKAKIAPELRLLFGIGGSAVWYHISNRMFKTAMPGMEQVFQQNPDLRRQVAEATLNTMQQQQPASGAGAFSGLMGMFGGFGGGSGTTPAMSQPAPAPQQRPHMRGPSNVDDLLSEIRQDKFNNNERLEQMSNVSESELTEMDDDASINGLLLSKKQKSKRRTLDI